jgi:hypothetical protein
MHLSSVEFGSLLSYSPRGTSNDEGLSRTIMRALKGDEYVNHPPKMMSDVVAGMISQRLDKMPFADLFRTNPVLIPTPTSSLTQRGTLWVPQRLAGAMRKVGLGRAVVECLNRVKPLRKAATSSSANRPTAIEHYESMDVQKKLSDPDEILLIDDVITRGATLVGAANKLADAYPNARIRAFAVIRTISQPSEFQGIYTPCRGEIQLVGNYTFRLP